MINFLNYNLKRNSNGSCNRIQKIFNINSIHYRGILIFFALILSVSIQQVSAQVVRAEGIVRTATDNKPVIAANVYIEGTTTGTITDINGNFEIDIEPGQNLVISSIGYKTIIFSFKGEKTLNFFLEEDVQFIEELVFIGYGKVRKSDLTGSLSSVKTEELQQTATVDVMQALQGRAAGVHITAQSGEPGEKMKVRIRGIGTINNSDPVFIVDGMPTDDISFLMPSDIETMEILKDASASAVYGSRGANGVILITTKTGTSIPKEAEINFNSYAGVQMASRTIKMCDATEYAQLKLLSYINDGIDINQISPANESLYKEVDKLKYIIDNEFRGTDWQSELLRPAMVQNYNLGISGGGEKYRYHLSSAYFDQEGIVKNSGLTRINFRLNAEFHHKEWLKGGSSASYVNTERTYIDKDLYTGVLTTALRADPVTIAWDSRNEKWGADQFSQVHNNPARRVYESEFDVGRSDKFIGNIWQEITFIEGLTFKSQYNFYYENYIRKTYLPEFFVSSKELKSPSELLDERIPESNWTWSNFFNYNRIKDIHSINLMFGSESQKMKSSHVKMGAYNVPSDAASHYFSSAKDKINFTLTTDPGYLWEQTMLSFFGRANYTFSEKYLFTGTFRFDGSSKFSEDNRWGFFPSFSLGWNMKREDIFKNVNFLSDLKMRAGWGKVGNEGSVLNYQYMSTMSPDQIYVFGNQLVEGRIPTTMSNKELRWEVSQMTNIGIDAGFLNRKLELTIDYFYKITKDILVITPVPYYFGTGAPYDNAADMSNSGIEFLINNRNRINEDFRYDIGFNISFIKNKIRGLGGVDMIESGKIGKLEAFTTKTLVGDEMAWFFGYKTDGIFQSQEEAEAYINSEGKRIQPNAQAGDVKFIDLNHDGGLDANDRTKLGSGNPDFTLGLNVILQYKYFDLKSFIHGVLGKEAINAMTANNMNPDGIENSRAARLNSWSEENQNTDVYRMSYSDPNNNIMRFSDLWVEDASYIRLRNIQVGFSLPEKLLKNMKAQEVRIYVSADNLLTYTKYSGWDPEIGDLFDNPFNNGIDMGTYPHAKTFLTGLSIRF